MKKIVHGVAKAVHATQRPLGLLDYLRTDVRSFLRMVRYSNPKAFRRMMSRGYFTLLIFLGGMFWFASVATAEVKVSGMPDSTQNSKESVRALAREAKSESYKKVPIQIPPPDPVLDKAPGTLKSLDGQMGGKNLFGMALVYEENEVDQYSRELWVKFNNKMKLVGFKKISELSPGDKVRVIFKETADGQRLLREISLLEKVPKENLLKSIERKFTKADSPQL